MAESEEEICLRAYLQDKHLLLLLDNFEQVLAAVPTLSHLLVGCPHLKIIVTSRAVLHMYGEYEFPVPPLSLPDLANLPEGEALLHPYGYAPHLFIIPSL